MTAPIDVLLSVLKLVDYEGDHQEMAKTFVTSLMAEITQSLLHLKPLPMRDEIERDLATHQGTGLNLDDILKKYFSQEEMGTVYQNEFKKKFSILLEELVPTLSMEKRDELRIYLTSLR